MTGPASEQGTSEPEAVITRAELLSLHAQAERDLDEELDESPGEEIDDE